MLHLNITKNIILSTCIYQNLLSVSVMHLLYTSFLGSENKVSAGVIDIQVELFPKTKQTVSNEVLTAQVGLVAVCYFVSHCLAP